MNIRRTAATALIAFVALAGAGCSELDGIDLPDIDVPTSAPAPSWADTDCEEGTEYVRDCFGSSWADVDGNGCDTRNDILARDLEAITLDSDDCTVLTGTLVSAYTGETINFERGEGTSSEVQIDHVIPLSWAWQNGADEWTDDEREAFANDPENLIAVDGHSNMSKSDSGPADWAPEINKCEYMKHFEQVANDYELPLDEADANGIAYACK